ncbi:Putative F-box protein At3g24700 [Linum grandiflorum]
MELDHVSKEEEKGIRCLTADPVVSKINEFVEDILIDILSRIPARTLLKLKSVCRRWNEVISCPLFVSMHLRNYTNSRSSVASSDSESLIYQVDDLMGRYKNMMQLDPDDDASQIIYIDYPEYTVPSPYYDELDPCHTNFKILSGSCNGIFLLQDGHDDNGLLAVWNPATGSFRELPAVPQPTRSRILPPDVYIYPHPVGFGVDSAANDFKFIFIQQLLRYNPQNHSGIVWLNSLEFPVQVMMYTLGTDTWKELQGFPYEVDIRHCPGYRYSNGFGFWLCLSPAAVLVFDFTNEVFRVVNNPVPDLFIPARIDCCRFLADRVKKIVMYGDSVALLAQRIRNPPDEFHLWTLNQEEWCWAKQSTVVSLGPREIVVGDWKEGKLVVHDGHESALRLFDPATNAPTTTVPVHCENYNDVDVFRYKDSLVSVGDEIRRIRIARKLGRRSGSCSYVKIRRKGIAETILVPQTSVYFVQTSSKKVPQQAWICKSVIHMYAAGTSQK